MATYTAPSSNPVAARNFDPLQLVICPACGYSLEGLPPVGTCPECGGRYDQSAIILHGWSRGFRSSLSMYSAHPWFAAAMLLAPAACFFVAASYVRRGNWLWVTYLVSAGLMGVSAIRLLWRRWNATTPGLTVVTLDGSGCRQTDDPAQPPALVPVRWDAIGDVLLKPTRAGRHRLRMRWRWATQWWHGLPNPVDAEVQLTPKQAELLRQWIDTCRRQASPR